MKNGFLYTYFSKFTIALLVLLAALLPGNARGSVGDSLPDRTFVTNGPVEAVVRAGDTIYIGGSFNSVGPRTGPGVELALDGSENAGLPEVTGGGGTVQAVAPDGSGGWYIGGLFTHVGGIARNNIAHIRADHSVDPVFDPSSNDGIHALAVSGSTVYAAGLFTSIGGQTRNRIAGLNAANGTATAFNPNADNTVLALVLSPSGSIIYAGGIFKNIGGQPRSNIAALNAADGTATLTFNPTSDGSVLALAISGPTLYAGGFFKVIGGQVRSNIAALNAGGPLDGTAIPTFNPNANTGDPIPGPGGVQALAVSPSGSTVYAGGLFTNIGGQNRRYFAALNASDGTATAFNPNPNSNILGLAVSVDGSTVYAAGGFNSTDGLPSIGGQVRNRFAAINAADGTATAFNPDLNGAAIAVAVSGSAVYVGGAFSSIGGLVRRGIAAINAADGTATSFDPNASFGAFGGTVYALAVSGSTVYAGGFFTAVGGQPRNYIAALNAADGTATSWNPGAGSIVRTFVVSDSIIYAGGSFTSIGGQPRNYIAALNLSDGSPTAFNPNPNGVVSAIAVSGPLVYAGGSFISIGGQTRNKIAALNAADGSATSWNPDATANAAVAALAVSGSTIYAGGEFVTIGGQARKNLAALNASDGTATSFDPQASDAVRALALSGSTVYAGGLFSTIGGQTRHLVAGLNPDGTATSFDPGAGPGFIVNALTVAPDGTLYVGGSFRTFDLAFQQGFAAFANPSLVPTGVVSRKTHGTAGAFDVDLPLTGAPGIECRSGGANGDYTLVFTFADPLTSVAGASLTSGTGAVNSSAIGADTHQYFVNLTGVANAQLITVGLTNVIDAAGHNSNALSASMALLIGDTTGDGFVNSADISQTKSKSGQAVDSSNFRQDVTTDGFLNSADISLVKSKSGTALP